MNDLEIEIMDLTKVASTFPQKPDPHISRDNLLSVIQDMVVREAEVLFVDGPDGIGKTTLLADFARHKPNNTFSIFLSGSSRYGYNPDIVSKDLFDQIGWVLSEENHKSDNDGQAQFLHPRITALQKKANYDKETYYFVVDGLHEIPLEGIPELNTILELLPFGFPKFRFIISGPATILGEQFKKIKLVSSFRVPGYSLEDTLQYLNGLNLTNAEVNEIHNLSRKNPGNLASLRRQLQKGESYQDLVSDLSNNTPDWLQLEWSSVEANDPNIKSILALIAFYPGPLKKERIAALTSTAINKIETFVNNCTLLTVNKDGTIIFICEPLRKIAATKLIAIRKITVELIIKSLLSEPASEETLTQLPLVLHQSGHDSDLLDFLSVDNLNLLIKVSESWVPLHQKMEMAIKSTLKLRRDEALIRFGLQNSALISIQEADPWRSEITAYAALGDYSAISAVAHQLPAKEDRLQLLAVIAKARAHEKMLPDHEINEQIAVLYSQIDCSSLGQRGIAIASDLLYTHPELAVDLVQSVTQKQGKEFNSDIAFAQLSLDALMQNDGSRDPTHKELRSKVKNPALRKYLDTTAVFFGKYSADAVIEEVRVWEKPADKIIALKNWAARNEKSNDAAKVLDFSFDLILRSSTYTASANIYYHLSRPLPHIDNIDYVRNTVARLDALKASIEISGPTSDYVRLQGVLAHAEYRYNRRSSFLRCSEIYNYLDNIPDSSTRLEGFSILVSALKRIDPDQNFSHEGPLLDLAIEGINSTADIILSKTASHYEAVRGALSVLATTQPSMAVAIASKLNTIRRRDRALAHICDRISRSSEINGQWEVMDNIRSSIRCPLSSASSTKNIIINVFENDNYQYSGNILSYKDLIDKIAGAEDRSRLYSILLEIVTRSGTLRDSLKTEIFDRISEEWIKITSGWKRIATGFYIVSILGKSHPEFSRDLLRKIEMQRGAIILDSKESAICYMGCIRLAIRAFSGLIKNNLFNLSDLENFQRLIERIPCEIHQAATWSEIAVRMHLGNHREHCSSIVENHILPIIDRLGSDLEAVYSATSTVSVALYCAHPPTAKARLSQLPAIFRDNALSTICEFIVEEKLPFEDYDDNLKPRENVNYSRFIDACEILESMVSDASFSWSFNKLIAGIGEKRFKTQFTQPQKLEIVRRLSTLIEEKLPNPDYITHDGYKIICETSLYRLSGKGDPDSFAQQARNLPNLADCSLVLMAIAGELPKKEKNKIVELLKESKELIPKIPFFEDRLHHFENLAFKAKESDRELSKASIKAAWAESIPIQAPEIPATKRRIIDFAHRLDPDFASALASEVTDDPGREFARAQVREQLSLIELKESLTSGKAMRDDPDLSPEKCAGLGEMMLRGLNSGRILTTLHVDKMRSYLGVAATSGMDESYRIFAWGIENSVRRFIDERSSTNNIRPLFDAARLAAELTFKIASRIRSVADQEIQAARHSDESGVLIRPGARDQALERIYRWAESAMGFIKITDPYFGPEDLDIVKMIRSANREIPIHILTGRAHHSEVAQPWEDTYRSYWRLSIADFDPGLVTITVVGWSLTNIHPIHDRWCLSQSSGLRLGTSLASIGATRSSEVSDIGIDEVSSLVTEFDGKLTGVVSNMSGDRLKRTTFDL